MSNPESALAESISTTNASIFIVIYILILIYCCFGLAVVCDAYFVPALQKISYTYDLPPDIAGSTLMALGASVPELFASLIGVFVTEDDIGTGSIIGSSCFNLIAVPAACAFVASATFAQKLTISPVPVIRNSAFYAITILVLLLIIKDNKVDIPEALILLVFFVMYMGFMIFCAQSKADKAGTGCHNPQMSLIDSYSSHQSHDSAISECGKRRATSRQQPQAYQELPPTTWQHHHQPQPLYGQYYLANNLEAFGPMDGAPTANGKKFATERTPLMGADRDNQAAVQANVVATSGIESACHSVSIDLGVAIKNSTCLLKARPIAASGGAAAANQAASQAANEHHGEDSWIDSMWILIPMLPITMSLRLLSPCKFKNTCWTIWTFLVSIALIGGLTYVSVTVVHLFGQTVGIPETVAGMTILSWGTGIPELIASIVLIKKTAQADMAICNTIGSNVIDASFCLSLPWIVKCLLNRAEGLKPEVAIQSAALPWTSFTLLLSVVLLITILKLNNWELSFSVGVWLTLTYVAFVGVATYLESTFSEQGLDLFAIL